MTSRGSRNQCGRGRKPVIAQRSSIAAIETDPYRATQLRRSSSKAPNYPANSRIGSSGMTMLRWLRPVLARGISRISKMHHANGETVAMPINLVAVRISRLPSKSLLSIAARIVTRASLAICPPSDRLRRALSKRRRPGMRRPVISVDSLVESALKRSAR